MHINTEPNISTQRRVYLNKATTMGVTVASGLSPLVMYGGDTWWQLYTLVLL